MQQATLAPSTSSQRVDQDCRAALSKRRAWSAVFAMTLCVSNLIASEFMPVSLLTPIAGGLAITEGQAGQAISISGVFAVLTSLFLTTLVGNLNRRVVLLALTGMMLVSGLIVSLAPNYAVLMVGRALLGIVIGGFWSLSAAIVMRLVPEGDVPRALGFLNGGNALATTVAAPLGSFLGEIIGWRGAFFVVVPLAAATFAWQALTLPSLAAEPRGGKTSALSVLRLPEARIGMLAVGLLFMGQFALFTYVRPFLENVTHVGVSSLSLILPASDHRRSRRWRAPVRYDGPQGHVHRQRTDPWRGSVGRHRGRPQSVREACAAKQD